MFFLAQARFIDQKAQPGNESVRRCFACRQKAQAQPASRFPGLVLDYVPEPLKIVCGSIARKREGNAGAQR
ncbi:hypothetical protein CEB3_c19990 [Peptococcaceae bacterium CEB3]|nr:hypothetical protein CEB3_c19990 [Peptococcaceae bacterium CEB3]